MMTQLVTFGGEMPRYTPDNLPPNAATKALDVDLSNQSLRSWRKPAKVSESTGLTIWSDDCIFLTWEDCNVTVAQEDLICKRVFVLGDGLPKYASYEDAEAGIWTRLDMPCNMPAPQLSTLTNVVKDFTFEQVIFVYTLVNKYNEESGPSFPSEPIPLNDDQVVMISGLPKTDEGHAFQRTRIYATRSIYQPPGATVKPTNAFFLLDEISYGKTAASVKFGAPGDALLTSDNSPLPQTAWDIAHWRSGHLSALADNKVRFSDMRQWTDWPDDYVMAVPGTAIRHLAGQEWGYVLTDERPLTIRLDNNCDTRRAHQATAYHEPVPIVGCRSAAMHGEAIVYASTHGLVMLRGPELLIVSRNFFDKIAWEAIHPEQMIGIVHEGHYFGFTDNYAFRMALPGTVYVDERPEAGLTSLSIRPRAVFETRDGKLLFATDDGIFQWNSGDDFMPLTWERKSWRFQGKVIMRAYSVDWKYTPLTSIKHWKENTLLIDKAPTKSGKSYRIPLCRSQRWGVTINGVSEVTRYQMATSVTELSQ